MTLDSEKGACPSNWHLGITALLHLEETGKRLMWLETNLCQHILRKQEIHLNLGSHDNNTHHFYKMVNGEQCIIKQNEIY